MESYTQKSFKKRKTPIAASACLIPSSKEESCFICRTGVHVVLGSVWSWGPCVHVVLGPYGPVVLWSMWSWGPCGSVVHVVLWSMWSMWSGGPWSVWSWDPCGPVVLWSWGLCGPMVHVVLWSMWFCGPGVHVVLWYWGSCGLMVLEMATCCLRGWKECSGKAIVLLTRFSFTLGVHLIV